MGILSRIFIRRSAPPPSGAASASFPSSIPFGNRDISLNSTVQACGNVIANAVSILPLNLYFRDPKTGARQRAGWHNLYNVAKYRPNLTETPVVFFGRMIRDILQKGNWYGWKSVVNGNVVGITRLVPEGMTEKYDGTTTIFCYNGVEYRDGPACPIMRITSLIVDDRGKGFSPLTYAKTAIQLGIQLDQYSLSSFGNGPNSKLIIDLSEMLADMANEEEAAKKVREVAEYVARNYTGAENAGKPLITLKGMKATEANIQSNRDAELLESRKWQELEICKIFGVPPFLVNGSYDIKYGNLEAAMTVFINFSLSPYLFHVAQRFNSLLSDYEQGAYYFEFDYSALLKADEKSRAEYYAKMFGLGAMSSNDIAAKENLEPDTSGAGDTRFVPANMMPLTPEVVDAYMAKAKAIAAGNLDPKAAPADPARAAGDQAQ